MSSGKTLTDLYITANSPGEIAGWVVPVVRALRLRLRPCRITLVILPCQYASGAELSYGADIGADRCIGIGGLGETLASDSLCDTASRRLVLHMGGDLMFSVYLSKRLGAPLWAYSSRPRWRRFVDRFFLPDDSSADRFRLMDVPSEQWEKIGYIALDSVNLSETEAESRERFGLTAQEPVITCLLGSRPVEYRYGVPFFAAVAAKVLDRFPDHRFFFPLAPTVREDLLMSSLRDSGIEWRGKSRVHAISLGEGRWAQVIRDSTLEILNCSKLAIAVPGTNNLQAAALFIPYIMVLPLNRADEYPLDGLPGLLPLWLPGMRKLKKEYIMRLNDRTDYVSLPNKMARRMIAPELRGILEPEDVSNKVTELLSSPEWLKIMERDFWELTHERGASTRLAERIAEWADNYSHGGRRGGGACLKRR